MIMMSGKKVTLHSETVYLFAILILSFAVAMVSAADFGVSMIVAPAYILSLAVDALTFGQSEYILQAGSFCRVLHSNAQIPSCLPYVFCHLSDIRRRA